MSVTTPWPEVQIRDFASIGTGARDTQDRVQSGQYPFFVRSQTVEPIDSWSFDGEAVLTAGDGVGTGKVFHYIDGKFDYHQRVYRISNFRPDVAGRYFFYQFSRNFLSRIESLTAKSSVDSVRMESISGMLIPLPERAEQERIVRAIDDVDDLIVVLDRLIAKRLAIKHGMMQELLSGRTRLAGFTAKWNGRRVEDLAEIHRSSIDPRQQKTREFQHFSLPAFDDREQPVVQQGSSIDSTKFVVPANAVLVSKLNPRIPRIWMPTHIGSSAIASTEFVVLTPRPGIDRSFLAWVMKSRGVSSRMRLLATGTTGSHARVHPRQVLRLQVQVPPADEQVAIARALDDADAEISTLVARRAKAISIKRGMMQELLTGRTRLPFSYEVFA